MAVRRKVAAVEPFRIYSGWDVRQAEEAEVFAHSVREHASIPVDIRFVSADPVVPGGPVCTRRAVTSFTYARFMVPSLCGYEGMAVYADGCDQLCLDDVAELAAIPMDGCAVKVVKHEFRGQARPRSWSSLMLMDCTKRTLWLPEAIETASDDWLMRFEPFADEEIGELPECWNQMCVPKLDPENELRTIELPEPPEGTKVAHWSYLSDPNGGSWITRSGSKVWAAARDRWRAA